MARIPRLRIIVGILVAGITFMVYLPALHNDFVNWDDNNYVYENPFIRSLDARLLVASFTGFHASNWHPLTWISHAVDYAVWGLNPLGHHLTNNILHALNTLMVVWFVMRLRDVHAVRAGRAISRPSGDDRGTLIAGAATGLLFGLHPIHVESVAWVSERKDLLCALFSLLALIAYAGYAAAKGAAGTPSRTAPRPGRDYLLSLGFFLLALLSKPMAVTIPLVLMIMDWCLFGRIDSMRSFWRAAGEKVPYIMLSIMSSVLTLLAQAQGGALKSVEVIPLQARVVVAAKALVVYLWKIAWPFNLVPFYPYPELGSLYSLRSFIYIVIVIAITATLFAAARRQRWWLSVWGYYAITLMPVLGLVQVGFQAMADRYMYLPSIGPFLAIGLLAAKTDEMAAASGRPVLVRGLAGILAVVILASLSFVTIKQIGVWKDSIIFWNYVIAREPVRVPIAYNNLGAAYSYRGLADEAIEQYRKALSLKPDHVESYNNLGNAYLAKGLADEAIGQYRRALSLKPEYVDTYNNLGNAYLAKGLADEAIEQYRRALSLKPGSPEAHYNIGVALYSKRLTDQAIEEYRAALNLDPTYAAAHNNLGNAYASKGLFDQAIEEYRKTLSLKPNLPETHYNLGLSYLKTGAMDMARKEFELTLVIRPDHYWARQALGSIAGGNP